MKTSPRFFATTALCTGLLFVSAAFAQEAVPVPVDLTAPVSTGAAAATAETQPATSATPDITAPISTGAVAATATPPAAPAAAPIKWEALADKSSIEWTALYSGKSMGGSFRLFTSEIVFDPEHLDQAHVSVQIDTAAVISDDTDAQQTLPTAEWFNSTAFPKAVFEAKTFRPLGEEKYEADGTLTIAGKSNPVTLPFSVHFYDDNSTLPAMRFAQVAAEVTIKRSEYGLNKGDWSKTDVLADEVKVTINLKAKQAGEPKPATP